MRQDFLRDLALGTGVGLRVDIGMLVLRGDLGYGLHAPYYNGTNHYFNIAFKKAFAFHRQSAILSDRVAGLPEIGFDNVRKGV